ncbi:OmpL47-type beta-barrel domain-containing protein [Bacteroidota bacterium]
MKTLRLNLTVAFLFCFLLGFAQNELALNSDGADNASTANSESSSVSEIQVIKPETSMFVSSENNVYFQKNMPIYLWVSSSPEANTDKHLLVTEDGGLNHFHLDTEGKNTVRSPWAVNPATGEYKSPMEDVIFDVYSDGIAPVTESIFNGAPKFYKEGKLYFGAGLEIDLNASDAVSGVDKTYLSINGTSYKQYSGKVSIDKEYENKVLYYSTDHVGNTEEPTTKEFLVDVTPPESEHSYTGAVSETILSPDAKIVISSSDNLSGVKAIKYKIGEGKEKTYTGPIALSSLPDGETEIKYYAIDNVANTEEENSTNEGSEGEAGSGKGAMSLYVDRIAPEVDIELVGDQFVNNYTFVSERTRVRLSAKDNRAGVDKITYGINIPSRSHEYVEPFPLLGNSGIQYVNYGAVDKVVNWTPRITKEVYLDKTAPKTKIAFVGNKFFNRDTLFINKNTKIKLSSYEVESGLTAVNYVIDGKETSVYSEPFVCEKDGFHQLNYFGQDNVNNKEVANIAEFVIDNSAPEIKYTFSVESIGIKEIDGVTYDIYPSNTLLYLAASDNAAGVRHIQYSINGGQLMAKTQIGYFKPGQFEIEITAKDVLNNEAKETIRFIIQN